MPSDDIAGNQPPSCGLLLEIICAAAKKDIDADAFAGHQKRAAGGLGGSAAFPGPHGDLRIVKCGRNLRRPGAAGARPLDLKRGIEFPLKIAGDLAASARRPPIEADRPAGLRFVIGREGARELVADRLVMRRDKNQRVVCRAE